MDGHWVTISGAHVMIRDGAIVKGPAALVGKKHGEVSEELSHRGTSTGGWKKNPTENGAYITDQGHQIGVTNGKISHGPAELIGKDANDYGTHGTKVRKLMGSSFEEAQKIDAVAKEWHKTKEDLRERATRKPSPAQAGEAAAEPDAGTKPGDKAIYIAADSADFGNQKQHLAEITGKDPKYGLKREFIGAREGKRGNRTGANISQPGLYEIGDIDKKGRKSLSYKAILKHPSGIGVVSHNIDSADIGRVAAHLHEGGDIHEAIDSKTGELHLSRTDVPAFLLSNPARAGYMAAMSLA